MRDGRKDAAAEDAGYFVGPTIFDQVSSEMKIWKDEIFAPVLSVMRVDTLEEAIELSQTVRNSRTALACSRSNGSSVRQFRETIDAGMLGVNLGVPAPMAFFPFSGWKKSFYGDLACERHGRR